ncbi:MAG: SUMF1/EgtB/PvdO family nonheme iron enzyme [Candidatus Eisenbacteria sp.]|nr:SUMF1/EgtB/PvdO family nonheme iron enzyme [Candidatus Eisenbacteria bacterium]
MARRGLVAAAAVTAIITAGCSSDDPVRVEATEGPPPPEWVHIAATAPDQITLRWEAGSANERGLQIRRSLHMDSGYADHDTVASDTEEYIDTIAVESATTYYYRILAYDVLGRRGDASPPVGAEAVENTTPSTPSNPTPSTNATGIEGLTPLIWSCSDADPGDTISHDLYFGQSRVGLELLAGGLSDTSFVPDFSVTLTRSYFWRVVTTDSHGATALSPIWNFSTRIEQVHIPDGYFIHGDCGLFSPDRPDLYCPSDNPLFVAAFNIDKFEVSNQLYSHFLQNLLDGHWIHVVDGRVYSKVADTLFAKTYPLGDEHSGVEFSESAGGQGSFIPRAGKENHPVIEVTWDGAQRYARSLGRRLPTEAEWEKTARGTSDACGDSLFLLPDSTELRVGVGFPYPWGTDADRHCFNYYDSGDPYESRVCVATTPAGFYDGSTHDGFSTKNNASQWGQDGVFDLAGNVAEWCQDSFEPYQSGSYGNLRVVKGGSWRSEAHWCQTFWRVGANVDSCDNAIGFRTVFSE